MPNRYKLSPNTLFPNGLLNEQVSNKLRGGYYTPKKISDFLVKWAVRNRESKVLEPSCGDGQFIESLASEFGNNINITGVELIPSEAKKALQRGNNNTKIVISDAFEWYYKSKEKFDAVVGNPPFVRYQNFPEKIRLLAFRLMQEEGLTPSRLTNSWLPFVVLATKTLKSGGRIGMVLPAELLQVTYAKEIRNYLSTKYKNIIIVTFRHLVFAKIQQEIILLLGERGDCTTSNISLLEFNDLSDLGDEEFISKKEQHRILDIDHDNEKWTQFYLSNNELNLIRSIEKSKGFIRLGDVASIDVGVVTGNNDFFILDTKKATKLNTIQSCSPIIGRSNHLSGILFKRSDYRKLSKLGERTLLFNPGRISRSELTTNAHKYILDGERLGVTSGYKCRIRLPDWWHIPSTWKPDAFLLRQIHEGPRIIANQTRATSTDTVHRVKMISNISAKLLAATFFNSLTFAFSEIRGRSYGGGVLELEPTEAENLLIPNPHSNKELPLDEIDKLIREKRTIEALNLVDSVVLKEVGLNNKEIQTLRNIWLKLKMRRNSRNHTPKKQIYSSNFSQLSTFA